MAVAAGRARPGLRRPVFVTAVCALLAVAAFVPTLRFGLVWDDLNLVVQNRSSPFRAFAHSFWYGGGAGTLGEDPFYRPLVNFSLGIDELIAGHRAWYFHLVNVVLHALVVTLVCVVIWYLIGSPWLMFAAGVVSAIHPFAADSVAYVSGRTDLLAAAALLIALLGLLRLLRRQDWLSVALIWGGFTVGVLSKETAAMFVLIAGVWIGVHARKALRPQVWVGLAGLVALFAAYMLARHAVLGSAVGMSVGRRPWAWLLLSLNSFGRLLAASVAPWGRRVFVWNLAAMTPISGNSVLGLAYFALPLVLRHVRQTREAMLSWLWGAAMLLPFAGLAGYGPSGRLLYIPGIGLGLLTLYAGRLDLPVHRRRARVVALAAAGYSVLLAGLVLPGRMSVWRDGYTLFHRMTSESPGYATGHFNYASELRRSGDNDGAAVEYRKAIALDSGMALAYSNLGALLQAKGELEEAESLYLRTIQLRPGYALAWNNLAIVRYRRGNSAGAVAAFRRAIDLKPDDASAVYNLGRLYQQAGIPDSAAVLFRRAYLLDPRDPRIRASYEQTRGGQP